MMVYAKGGDMPAPIPECPAENPAQVKIKENIMGKFFQRNEEIYAALLAQISSFAIVAETRNTAVIKTTLQFQHKQPTHHSAQNTALPA